MSDEARTIELLRQTFAAILAVAVTLAGVAGHVRTGAVAPAGGSREPVPSVSMREPVPSVSEPGSDTSLEPVGPVLQVAGGITAGHSWAYQLYRNAKGELCTRWGGSRAPGRAARPGIR